MSDGYFERIAAAICYAEFESNPGIDKGAYWAKVTPGNKEKYRVAAHAAVEKLNEIWNRPGTEASDQAST